MKSKKKCDDRKIQSKSGKRCKKWVIMHAGKGGTVAILDVEDYVKEAERQLKLINYDPTTANNEVINKVISRFQK